MALVWAICDVIGNGKAPKRNVAEDGPYRCAAHGAGPYRALIPPGASWCLISIDADPVALAAMPGVDVLPDERLDVVLTVQRANQANNALGRRGLPELAVAGMTYRELIEAIAAEIEPGWSTDYFPGVT